MNPSNTHNERYITLDGPLAPALVIAVGVALLILFAWTLWRERSVLKPGQVLLFWVLRGVALATAVWMLLAPASVQVETSTTRKAVAVFADASASMQTVDPAGTSDDLRWAVSLSKTKTDSPTQAADKAVAALGIAEHQLRRGIEALKQHKPESESIGSLTSAQRALERARRHMQSVVRASHGSSEIGGLARRLVETLEGPEMQAFDELCTALGKGRSPAEKGWRESLPDLELRLGGIRQGLLELSRASSASESSRIAKSQPALLTTARAESRLGRTADFLDKLRDSTFSNVSDRADVIVSSFDRSVHRLGDGASLRASLKPAAKGDLDERTAVAGTDLSAVFADLKKEGKQRPLAAAVVFTDAAHNQRGEIDPREAAARMAGTPVYVVPLGNSRHVKDVVLEAVSAPKVAMRNDDIVIEVSVQTYECRDETCTVQLLHDGEVVDFREVTFDSDFASRTVRFEQKVPAVGRQQFQVALEPIRGEVTEENNYDEFEVNVTRSDIQVLLADELPRWEYRYLAQLFRRDAKINCDELLFRPRMVATGRREQTKTVPVDIDGWDQYDVVILGDLPPEHFSVAAQESLAEYLRARGGTLVLIAGRESMPQAYRKSPLEDILPVQPLETSALQDASSYAFRLTPVGRDHPALMIAESDQATQVAWDFVNRFSPFHEVSDWRVPRPSAHTLISAVPRGKSDEEHPGAFLCWQAVGRGRILYFSGPETYRLRFLRGDRFHHRFWGQLLRWAIASDMTAGSELVRIRTDRSRYTTREPLDVWVHLSDSDGRAVESEDEQLRVTTADREQVVPLVPSPEVPGEYRARLAALSPGVYRVEPFGPRVDPLQKESPQGAVSASFTVQAELPRELADTRCDRALAQQIAKVTGGQVLPPTAVDEVFALMDLDPIVSERVERRPLWLEWRYLWIVFGCLLSEWVVRKWKGLS